MFIPNEKTVGGFSMTSSPLHLQRTGNLELAIKYSTWPPAFWIHTQVRQDDFDFTDYVMYSTTGLTLFYNNSNSSLLFSVKLDPKSGFRLEGTFSLIVLILMLRLTGFYFLLEEWESIH